MQEIGRLKLFKDPLSLLLAIPSDVLNEDLVWSPHLEEMNQIMLSMCWVYKDGKISPAPYKNRNVIMTAPPRTGKTLLSVAFMIWYASYKGSEPSMFIGYGQDFVNDYKRLTYKILTQCQDILPFRNVETISDKVAYKVLPRSGESGKRSGAMLFVPVRGQVQGRAGGLIIVDDVVKGIEQLDMPSEELAIKRAFATAVLTRMQPKTRILVSHIRLSRTDIIGDILDKDVGVNNWRYFPFPAWTEERGWVFSDVKNAEGMPVISKEWWEDRRKAFPAYQWLTIYQCNPTPSSGLVFNKDAFKYCTYKDGEIKTEDGETVKVSNIRYILSADAAYTTKTSSDYTVALHCATDGKRLFVLKMWRERVSIIDSIAFYENIWNELQSQGVAPRQMLIETVVLREVLGKKVPVRYIHMKQSKTATAETSSLVLYNNGNLFHNKDMSNLGDFENELLAFGSRHCKDDAVDALSHAARQVVGSGALAKIVAAGGRATWRKG